MSHWAGRGGRRLVLVDPAVRGALETVPEEAQRLMARVANGLNRFAVSSWMPFACDPDGVARPPRPGGEPGREPMK